MFRLEKLCALHSNAGHQNVNFGLNLDEMCSLLTWGQFHSLPPPLFMGALNLFHLFLPLSLSLLGEKKWTGLCSRSVQTMLKPRRCFTAAISAEEMALWIVSACFLRRFVRQPIVHFYCSQSWKWIVLRTFTFLGEIRSPQVLRIKRAFLRPIDPRDDKLLSSVTRGARIQHSDSRDGFKGFTPACGLQRCMMGTESLWCEGAGWGEKQERK